MRPLHAKDLMASAVISIGADMTIVDHWLEFLLSPGHAADEYAIAHGRKVAERELKLPSTASN